MHVVKIRDDQGEERIYAAKLLRRIGDFMTFDFNGIELKVDMKYLMEMVPVFARASANQN
jgi:hypothetical protein